MANAFYAKGAEKILSGAIDFSSDTIKVALLKNTYPQNLAADEFLAGISAYVVGTPQVLGSKSITGGKLDAADPTFAAVSAGDTVEALVLFKDSGDPATSPLLAYIDTAIGLPLTTNGGDVTPQWDNGAYKIVSLV